MAKPDLKSLFNDLKKIVKKHEKHFTAKVDDSSHYEFWSTTDIVHD